MMDENKKIRKIYRTPEYILWTILSVILTFLLTSLLLLCMTVHYYVKTAAIPEAVAAVAMENIQIPQSDGTEKTLAEYILDEYVQDERVTVEDVQEVLENGTFSEFVGTLTEQYNHYLADGGTFPELDADEFVELLEENADLIYDKTGLRFLDPDKKKLKENLDHPLNALNKILESYMYKGTGGFFLRLAVSFQTQIVLIVLMIAALVWMVIIHIRGQKRVGTALEIFSVTAFQPCLICFMGGLLMSWILNLAHLPGELGTVLRGRTITFSGIGILICAAVFFFGKIWNLIADKPVKSEPLDEEKHLQTATATDTAFVKLPEEKTEPKQTAPMTFPKKKIILEKDSVPVPDRKFCRFCGAKLSMTNANYCSQCAKKQ